MIKAYFKIILQAIGGLISILCILGHEPGNDAAYDFWYYRVDHIDWFGDLGDVCMYKFHCIGCRERKTSCNCFIQGDPEGVEIGAIIYRPVHSPRLFRRIICKGSFQSLGITEVVVFQVKAGGDSEVDDLDSPFLEVDQDIERTDVFVDDIVLVDLSEGIGCTDSHVEKVKDVILLLLENLLERSGREILQVKCVSVLCFGAFQNVAGAFERQPVDDIKLVVKLGDLDRSREFKVEDLHDDGSVPLPVVYQVDL